MTLLAETALPEVTAFLNRWMDGDGGQERANYSLFLSELCDALAVPRPDPASHDTSLNAYTFERHVTFREPDGSSSIGRIDLYKRGCFVLEAKQSRRPGGAKAIPAPASLLPLPEMTPKTRGKREGARGWDVLMMGARQQAEDYAKALPTSEGWPPFLLVCDVGHCFEIYADFSGQGKNYAQFPDRQGFRIYLEDLAKPEIRERLALIWQDPHKLDPAKIAARVTREVAARLAKISKHLEDAVDANGRKLHDPEAVALFLMRCLFTMFAEDIELLPKDSFRDLLARCVEKPALFPPLVEQLWKAMDIGGFAYGLELKVRRFNGYLFKSRTVFPLPASEISELYEAAKADWRQVEPAIFGTLLEQALNPAERRKLGAHYTPRAYVERLVIATVLEPLKAEWGHVQAAAEALRADNNAGAARAEIAAFHQRLCALRILDPACGTGNFLYVALELMKRLEGEVLEALASLAAQGNIELATIDPHQFLGLEVNPRAAAIAELVLWIGYLQWQSRTLSEKPLEPILKDFKTIVVQDAVLAWSARELARGADGRPLERTDAEGDRVEVYAYANPRRPQWPVADYIVGNPPFIGGKDVRSRLGEGYVQALWAAHPHMNESADFVMYWWDRAAEILTRKGTALKRFGFVTTNSLSQVFQRRVIERHFASKPPVSLLMAIADHPWTKATKDAAAVRIAMTVVALGAQEGRLLEVTHEAALDTDEPIVEMREVIGRINSDLTVGVDVTKAMALEANESICHDGVKLHGKGFIITPAEALSLGLGKRQGLEKYIRGYRNGRDLAQRLRGLMVIDLFGLEAEQVRTRFPEVYQHVLETVKAQRDAQFARTHTKDAKAYARLWWLFGKPRQELRPALEGLRRFIATVDTARHRIFQFLDSSIICDDKSVIIASDDGYCIGVLSSKIHVVWSIRAGGWLGVGNDPVYTKSRTFDPFPFPDASETLKSQIRGLAEELDGLRKQCQAAHPGLTLTQIYNVLEKLRARAALSADEEAIKTRGLVLIVKELHDSIDALVAQAYGWPATLSDAEILARLVNLNAARAQEEQRGLIRWLRPDYQRPRAGLIDAQAAAEAGAQLTVALPLDTKAQKPLFPTSDIERTAAIFAALMGASTPLDAATLAKSFRQGTRIEPAITRLLASLARLGHTHSSDNQTFTLRRSR